MIKCTQKRCVSGKARENCQPEVYLMASMLQKSNILKENYKTVKPYMAVLQRQGSVQRRASQGQYQDEQAKHFQPIVQK